MIQKVNYDEVKDSFIATFGKTNFIGKNKPRVGISPTGIWLGHAHPETIVNGQDNTIGPVGVLRWEWIKRIEISDMSKDRYGYLVFVLRDFEAVWQTIPTMSRLAIKSACTLTGDEGKVLAYPAHIAFDFTGDDYNAFYGIIKENNFTEINVIGHIEESYKASTMQNAMSVVYIVLFVLIFLSILMQFLG